MSQQGILEEKPRLKQSSRYKDRVLEAADTLRYVGETKKYEQYRGHYRSSIEPNFRCALGVLASEWLGWNGDLYDPVIARPVFMLAQDLKLPYDISSCIARMNDNGMTFTQ